MVLSLAVAAFTGCTAETAAPPVDVFTQSGNSLPAGGGSAGGNGGGGGAGGDWPAVALPAGQVPAFIVGDWSGGEGAGKGEKLQIASDGSYRRSRTGYGVIGQGVVVADTHRIAFFGPDGSQAPGSYEYVDAGGGIEVLSFTFDNDGYYSYVRI
ncbi:hypothetical protein MXD62_31875 [Frankia sp. Mgl5]|uniref:hypothetical protein n=1 Tax=Frankia sp. Mgl5 TaxID=2933793 RepID=UPI00200C7683|nr:hypothetical protein [Frankia sp. Mgl5]MCK9931685.1 hypothetical protein [Frankia sp. Mgl5]